VAFGILKAGGSGLKPLLPRCRFGRSGFRRDLAPPKTEDAGLRGAASSVAFGILKADSGLKPLLPNRTMCFGRSGFSRDPCVIEGGRFGIVGGGFIRGLWDLEGRGSGLKPLLQKERCVLVGAALAATLAPSKAEGSELWGTAFIRGLWDLEGRRFGAEAPPTKMSFW
jgi:hypothetical protein